MQQYKTISVVDFEAQYDLEEEEMLRTILILKCLVLTIILNLSLEMDQLYMVLTDSYIHTLYI